jgi:hypothetical protein
MDPAFESPVEMRFVEVAVYADHETCELEEARLRGNPDLLPPGETDPNWYASVLACHPVNPEDFIS